MKKLLLSAICVSSIMCFAVEDGKYIYLLSNENEENKASKIEDFKLFQLVADSNNKRYSLSRKDSLPPDHLSRVDDFYLEGYIQALIDTHYYEMNVLVYVDHGVVYLYNLPNNRLTANSIISFVQDVPSVKEVKVTDKFPSKEVEIQEKYEVRNQIKGIWFPEATVLYPPMLAAPREYGYELGFRFGDQVLGSPAAEFSLGDDFPIFRWTNVWGGGDVQLDIIGCMWAVFKMWGDNNPNDEISELVTTDYEGALTLSYAIDNWSFRLRGYHVSSHLGDEFMVNHPHVARLNPSMEAIDLFTAYQVSEGLRLYAGPGWIVNSDNSFPMDNFYIEYGGELRIFGHKNYYHKLYSCPFLAMYFRNWQVNDWRLDQTYKLGWEWSKLQGVGRKFRLFLEFHDGYSEGQFFKEMTTYGVVGLSWGF
ncbi:MAG: DUF1207 domain-containing protein [Chlamydiales bacterium]|nr:DUF1207 domain-containing protein [Chlamydiales bacterium]